MSQPNGEPVPDTDLPSQSAATQPTSGWARSEQIGQQVAADLPEGTSVFGAAKAGWQAGRAEAQQSAQTHWGYVGADGADPAAHGTITNGDGGPELATSEDVAGLHSRFDELSGQVGGMASSGQGAGGGQGNSNLQGLTPSRMPERPASVSPLAASADARSRALDRMSAGQQNLANTRANFSANFAARQQASSAGMAPATGSGNSIGSTTSQASMGGILTGSPMRPASGIGQSESTFANTRFRS